MLSILEFDVLFFSKGERLQTWEVLKNKLGKWLQYIMDWE